MAEATHLGHRTNRLVELAQAGVQAGSYHTGAPA